MDRFSRYGNLLKSDGTNQLQRTLPALEQDYVVPDERSLSELIDYARQLAAEIRFYNLSGQATGDWRPFLEPLIDPATGRARPTPELEAAMAARHDWPAHVTLFLVFLKLFRHLQTDLNELPARHLSYYYEQVLGLARRTAAADQVHVIFELARNAAPTRLAAGTALDAGRDTQGRSLVYKTTSERVVSPARIGSIRRLLVEADRRGRRRFFAAAAVSEAEGESWHTFGRRQLDLDAEQRFMSEAELGFAIASPLLQMAEGRRTLTVTAILGAVSGVFPPAQNLATALTAELTGAEGWVKPDSFQASLIDNGSDSMTLAIELSLNEAAPAIVPFDAALHGAGPVSEHPVLRCLLHGEAGRYEVLDGLVLDNAALSIKVEGVRDLVIQSDEGTLNPEQPIPLFGSQPRIGSRFFIGSAEIFAKRLTSLALHLEWQDLPEDLFNHYRAYFDFIDGNLSGGFRSLFVADLDLLYERSWDYPLLANQLLFASPTAAPRTIRADASAFDSAFGERPYRAQPGLNEPARFDAASQYGFVRLVLRGPTQDDLHNSFGVPYASEVPFDAFGHRAFARRYANRAIALARWGGTGTEPKLPAEPYTPTLAGLTLDYTATADLVPGDLHSDETLFVLGPWGYTPAGDEVAARLMPAFDGRAALYLGVEKLTPPANLALLFQIDSGTASGAEVLEAGETEWSYLSRAVWKTLPVGAVLKDDTRGFQQPGLVVLAIPGDATTGHTRMPAGMLWLRALIQRPPESASRTLALHTQAALAGFAPPTGTLDDFEKHLQQGLAAQTITRLKQRDAAIKGVSQPYPSFGGSGSEPDADFFRRASERLRHRNRAVTVWDFERLVLEAFPEVFKVKCLPHSDAGGNEKPGEAALVIVPDLRNSQSTHLLEPRAGTVLMSRIEDYVGSALASPFATIHIIHPLYERIRVDVRVSFHPGLDAGFYAGRLNEDLRRFLSPWAFEEGRDILFGARIYKSEILAFLESRDYVDFVTDFDLYHIYDGPPRRGIGRMRIGIDFMIQPDPRPSIGAMHIGDDFVVGRGVEVAETTRPHAILVSHAEHRITPLAPGEEHCRGVDQLGIGYLTVGLDFKVFPD